MLEEVWARNVLGSLSRHELLEARSGARRALDELEVALLSCGLDGTADSLLASGSSLCCVSLSGLLGLGSLLKKVGQPKVKNLGNQFTEKSRTLPPPIFAGVF